MGAHKYNYDILEIEVLCTITWEIYGRGQVCLLINWKIQIVLLLVYQYEQYTIIVKITIYIMNTIAYVYIYIYMYK